MYLAKGWARPQYVLCRLGNLGGAPESLGVYNCLAVIMQGNPQHNFVFALPSVDP